MRQLTAVLAVAASLLLAGCSHWWYGPPHGKRFPDAPDLTIIPPSHEPIYSPGRSGDSSSEEKPASKEKKPSSESASGDKS